MGLLGNLLHGRGGGWKSYETQVRQHLTRDYKVERRHKWSAPFDYLLIESQKRRMPFERAALEIAVANYQAVCLGDAQDRQTSSELYFHLKPRLGIARLAGLISAERFEQLSNIVRDSTQTAGFADLEQGTGMFAEKK